MTDRQTNPEAKTIAVLNRLGADLGWLGAGSVDSVYFTRVRITDLDLKHLKELSDLRKLKLNGSPITDTGLKQLQGLTNLVQLQLSGTNVTDAGLEHLTSLKNLGFLDVSDTQVTGAGLKYLK